MKLLTTRSILFSTLILILTGCQSGRDGPTQIGVGEPSGGPIVSKHLPAQASQEFLPGSQVPTTKVAILLPLTGQQAHLGNAMLNAAQMSLFENAPDHVELISEDTQGNPEGAARAADKVIREGAKIIVGPLFSNEAIAVARVASMHQVPVLTFSNNQSVANQNVYALGYMPEQQMKRLFTVAQSKGINQISLLAPNNESGKAIGMQAENAARSAGVQLRTLGAYKPGAMDLKQQATELKQSGSQAVLIPEGGQQLRIIVASLLANEVDASKVKFLGTGQWDSPDVYNDKSLNGSWFSASPISLRQQFIKKYTSSYGQQPPRLATLAYDAISMISLIARTKGSQQGFFSQDLTQPRGFQGIDGIFRLYPDGTVQRGLAVYEISDVSGLTVVSPAPEAF